MKLSDNEIKELIKRRRKQIVVHSFGYYRMNDTLVNDSVFDSWCNELVNLQKEYPDIAKQVELHDYFEDFDGSTGFNLPIGDPWVAIVWERIKDNSNTRG